MRRRLHLGLLAALVPTGRTGGYTRGPLHHRPLFNAPAPGDGGKGPTPTGGGGNPPANDPPAGGDDPPKTFTQADLDRILARERASLARKHEAQLAELRGKLPPEDGDDPPADPAPTGKKPPTPAPATDPKSARELARIQKERDDARAAVEKERTARHGLLAETAVTRALVGVEFVGADAAESVETSLRGFVRIEEEDGREVAYFVDPKTKAEIAATDREKVAQWVRKRWPSLIKAQGGTGANHGRGNGGTAEDTSNLTPAQKIARSQQKPQ